MLLFIECNVFRGHPKKKRFSVSFTAIFDLVARSINFHKQANV